MKLVTKIKKGFTLVELIVVIAIVAILAAVSVVSYLAFINSANESADIQLVKQLNVCLQADEIMNGTRSTPHEMEQMLEDNGFILENLTKTKTGYDIVWDQQTNRCVLLKERETFYSEKSFTLSPKSWFMVDTKEEAESISHLRNSVYLTRMVGELSEINIECGLDTGENKVGTVNYANTGVAQEITIRTDSEETVLNVDGKAGADGDTVKHFGVAANVYENSCGKHSYDEYGYIIGYIFSKDGHVHVVQKKDTNISASAVVITDDTVSVDVEDETPVVYASTMTQQEIVDMQANVNASNNSYDPDSTEPTPTYDVEELEENTGGLGTEVSPYVIATSSKLQEALNNKENFWYRLFKDITIDIQDFTYDGNYAFGSYFIGHFDGNNSNIIITNTRGLAMNNTSNTHRIMSKAAGYLSNFNVINNTGNNVSIVKGDTDTPTVENPICTLEFRNINYGYEGVDQTLVILVKNTGLFTQTSVGNYSFYDCANYYDIECTSGKYNGIFVGGRVSGSNASSIQLLFNGCKNYGNVFAYAEFGILVGNANGNRNTENTTVINCYNSGTVSGFNRVGFISWPGNPVLDPSFASGLTNEGSFDLLANDGSDLTSDHAKTFILHKGSQADNFKFIIYETFKVKDGSIENPNDRWTGMTLSVNIQETYLASELEFDSSNNAILPFQRTSYIGYNLWKSTYNSNNEYTGSWKNSLEDNRYFYYYDEASEKGMWVIDIAARFEKFLLDNDLPDYYYLEEDDLSTNVSITMVAYNGTTPVAVKSLDYNG